jgi:hypothetical protein
MSMLDDDAEVETVARPAARSRDKKAAIAYLIASGATAICIIEDDTGCTFHVGAKSTRAPHRCIGCPKAKPVLKLAQRAAGKSPDICTASAALKRC